MGRQRASSSYQMGNSTLEVPITLFAENRNRLLAELKKVTPKSIVFLQGGVAINHYNTDTEYPFRQEPFFHWLFGVTEPNFYGAIDVLTEKSYLFYPKPSSTDCVWVGKLPTQDEFTKKYMVDSVLYEDDIYATLSNLNRDSLLVLKGTNTDSKLAFETPKIPSIESFKVDYTTLYPIIVELRVIKTPLEINVMRYASKISSNAHKYVMKNLKPGMYEYQAEALFSFYVYNVGGCRSCAYTCICASGENSAILHYGHAAKPNDKKILDGDLCLFDMGGSYYGYASDITVSFPINGKFSKNQEIVYNAVLKARDAVYKNLGPGSYWSNLHRSGVAAILSYLQELKLLKPGKIDDMIEAGLGAVFQPHGLGHLIGIDVHDVGGYTENTPQRPMKHGLHTLRTARKLLSNMVMTVEPGCYFIEEVLDAAFENPALKPYLTEQINEFRGIGGVRLEDVVLITDSGYEILSVLPRTIEEVENFMANPTIEDL
uniref:Xaa-Pro dipeptidase n=1 Tax=Riptortus pedestris TaxID=329032 RepID=R4WJQ2_RIPPE|nr:xaa-pro dipeptidase pepd/pepq [Riptortus pedestris]